MNDKPKLLLPVALTKGSHSKPSTGTELVAAIEKSRIVGMWADRDGIRDSRGFVRRLRKQASKRR